MSELSQALLINVIVLAVVLEADLGPHRKITWFRVLRPLVLAGVIIPIYLKSLSTHGTGLYLELAGLAAGVLLGLLATALMGSTAVRGRAGPSAAAASATPPSGSPSSAREWRSPTIRALVRLPARNLDDRAPRARRSYHRCPHSQRRGHPAHPHARPRRRAAPGQQPRRRKRHSGQDRARKKQPGPLNLAARGRPGRAVSCPPSRRAGGMPGQRRPDSRR
jgi:hypothetical protein